MSPPNQGFKYSRSLTATAADNTAALVAACGASRGGGIQLSGTWVGTISFEQTLDNGTTWIAKTVYPAAGGAGVTSSTANGQWKFACGGETQIRARCSAYTSGTIVVDATFTAGFDETVVGAGTAGFPSGGVQSVQDPEPPGVLDVTLVLDTSAYVDGDVMAVTQEITGFVNNAAGTRTLASLVVLDEDDQGQPFDLLFLDTNVSIGTLNAAVSVSDTNARKIIGRTSVLSGDYYDLGGCRNATVTGLGLPLKAAAASTSLFIAAVSRGTGTYTASGIKLKLGFV